VSDQATIKDKFERLHLAMDEKMCRLWAANEALALGWGGESVVSAATGLSRARIRSGLEELKQLAANAGEAVLCQRKDSLRSSRATRRIRRPGGGRKLTEVKHPGMELHDTTRARFKQKPVIERHLPRVPRGQSGHKKYSSRPVARLDTSPAGDCSLVSDFVQRFADKTPLSTWK
jgi:hypothetical protein